ncbi:MAG TPA: helix-turn-helix transcriptional regulator [Rubrivivax sp.]|nr:helix-turn-helix transcriptional regulator [Rubrivivax sp.]
MKPDNLNRSPGPVFGVVWPRQPIAIKVVRLPAGGSFPADRHTWGQFVYAMAGVIELTVTSSRYAAPPDFGVWLPPQTEHLAWAGDRAAYLVLDIDRCACGSLPGKACLIAVSPIAKAILQDLDQRGVRVAESAEDSRLMHVLIDQFAGGASLDTFVPVSNDRILKPVLDALLRDPGDNRSLVHWAMQVHSTERTLARRCQRELGMSFARWRQRLRLTRAMAMLADGRPVQSIANELGYSTASAFIAMFQGAIGVTPSAFRDAAPRARNAPQAAASLACTRSPAGRDARAPRPAPATAGPRRRAATAARSSGAG